jgi:uncharacterized protein
MTAVARAGRHAVLVIALSLFAGGGAVAQGNPSFDCAKASNAVERTICARPDLAKADRTLAAVYAGLAGTLSGPAKNHLAKDQTQWVVARNKACVGTVHEIEICLKRRYEQRTANLRVLAEGAYPFISEQALLEEGKIGRVSYDVDASWPQFDGTTADFSALNRRFAALARKSATESMPDQHSASDIDRDQDWSYEQSFTLQRPLPTAVSIAVAFYGFTGGAHGFSGTTAYLVDLRTGRAASPDDVFARGDQWLKVLVPLVRTNLEKQFNDGKPGFEDAITPAKLAELLREPGHYYYRRDRLELVFDAYVVGPYVSGPFTVDIPYATLKPLLDAEGPLGALR